MFDLYSLYSDAGHNASSINHAASTERDRLEAVIYARTGIVPSKGFGYGPNGMVHTVNLYATFNGNGVHIAYRDDTQEFGVSVNGGPLMPRDRKATSAFRTASEMGETFHNYVDAYVSADRARAEMFGRSFSEFPVSE